MHIVTPYAKIVRYMGSDGTDAVRFIEETGRKCYRSEGGITDTSYVQFLSSHTLANFHTSMLRFSCVVVDAMVDRGVAQEWTRHGKTLDFQHESQRYCNYSKGKFGGSVGFIRPTGLTPDQDRWWRESMTAAEMAYFAGLEWGLKPQIAADALPRATASLLTIVGNFQAWRHFLLARTTVQCHPKMLDVTCKDDRPRDVDEDSDVFDSLLTQFQRTFPLLFDDIQPFGKFAENMKMAR
jgi:thymidylate synthase (FAD)